MTGMSYTTSDPARVDEFTDAVAPVTIVTFAIDRLHCAVLNHVDGMETPRQC